MKEYQFDKSIDQITPFWRAIEPDSKLVKKLTFGIEFLVKNQLQEGIEF
jgi:hypothetical protein